MYVPLYVCTFWLVACELWELVEYAVFEVCFYTYDAGCSDPGRRMSAVCLCMIAEMG